jgi:hypothetical protein
MLGDPDLQLADRCHLRRLQGAGHDLNHLRQIEQIVLSV